MVRCIIAEPRTLATANAFVSFDLQMVCEMLLLVKELAPVDLKAEQSLVKALHHSLQATLIHWPGLVGAEGGLTHCVFIPWHCFDV